MIARKLIVALALVAIAATACGSSSKSSSTTQPGGSSATTAPSGSASGTTAPKSFSGDSGSNFCDLARKDETAFKGNSLATGSTPADLKKLYSGLGPALQEAESKAPSVIKDDFKTFVDAYQQILKAMSDANYDVTKLNPATFAAFDSAQIKAASDHIEAYMTQVCHITSTT